MLLKLLTLQLLLDVYMNVIAQTEVTIGNARYIEDLYSNHAAHIERENEVRGA